jgi:hypothetical protein
VSTPLDLLPRPSSGHPLPVGREVGLDEVLALFADVPLVSARRTLRRSGAHLLGWAASSRRRAAAWGAVAEPVAVRSTRSTSTVMEAGQ